MLHAQTGSHPLYLCPCVISVIRVMPASIAEARHCTLQCTIAPVLMSLHEQQLRVAATIIIHQKHLQSSSHQKAWAEIIKGVA